MHNIYKSTFYLYYDIVKMSVFLFFLKMIMACCIGLDNTTNTY